MAFSTEDKQVVDRYEELVADRGQYDNLWQHISDYIIPRKSEIQTEKAPDTSDYVEDIFDMTAAQANLTLAAGIMTNAVPKTERWFSFSPPEIILNDETKRQKASGWFDTVSAITAKALAKSNFYTEFHEAMLDRNALGTCALYVAAGKKELLNFRSIQVGNFVIDLDSEGNVDTIMRCLRWNARQAEEEFGKENLSEQMQKDLTKGEAGKKYELLHIVRPRKDAIPGRNDPENKPIQSLWLDKDNTHRLRNSGFDEMPTNVSRFLQWKDRSYGWCPGIQCLPLVRQTNFIEQKMDQLAEISVDPRTLVPITMIDEVDYRAGGETPFDPNQPGAKPEEWLTNGRYDVGKDRAETKKQEIRDCFHNELFQMFQNLEREITATETMARLEEKLDAISPTFGRITSELLDPTLTRVFSLLFRAGVFPEPPAEAFIQTVAGFELPLPEVSYTSKLALALKAKENGSLNSVIATLAPLAELDPTIMDVFDLDTISRDVSHNFSLPHRWMKDAEEVAQIRAARAAEQQAAQEAALLESGTKSAANIAKAPQEIQEQFA
jgi:hypothetical protein